MAEEFLTNTTHMEVINSRIGTFMINLPTIKHTFQRAGTQMAKAGHQIGRGTSHMASALVAEIRSVSVSQQKPRATNRSERRVHFSDETTELRLQKTTPRRPALQRQARSTTLKTQRTPKAVPAVGMTSAPKVSNPVDNRKVFDEMLADLEIESAKYCMISTPKVSNPVDYRKVFDEVLANHPSGYPKYDPSGLQPSFDPGDPDELLAELQADIKAESQKHGLTADPKASDPVKNHEALAAPQAAVENPVADATWSEANDLIGQLEAKRLAQPTFARRQSARKAVDDTTAELTALMDGLKRDISNSRGQWIASASEMHPAEKVTVSAHPPMAAPAVQLLTQAERSAYVDELIAESGLGRA